MGKVEGSANLPVNPSLSLTLDSLCTVMEVRRISGPSRFVSELPRAAESLSGGGAWKPVTPDLGEAGAGRMARHLDRVRRAAPALFDRVGLAPARELETAGFEFRSANTFPASVGIASSASSFAAATLATAQASAEDPDAFARAYDRDPSLRRSLASLAREGSGSSCRSFEGPWVRWEGESAAEARSAMPAMSDLVLVVGRSAKTVSSSEAHARVRSSPLWQGRAERAASRLRELESALAAGDVATVSRIAWSESWEMHSLFHTASEPFTYWEPGSVAVLRGLAPRIGQGPDAPIVTMDAGANVHVLVRSERRDEWIQRLRGEFPGLDVLWDDQGPGARLL